MLISKNMHQVTNINEWNGMITKSKTDMIVLDFWATWCMPCKVMGEVLKKVDGKKVDGKRTVSVYKIDVDKSTDLLDMLRLNITSLPTLYFIHNGKVVSQSVGSCTESQLETKIKNCVSNQ